MNAGTGEPSPALARPKVIPPVLVQPGVEQLDSPVTIPEDTAFPIPTFAKAVRDDQKRQMPQCIAHRGYKARFPENTLLAFDEAIKAGAHAIETDLHLTKDDVVVLCHDQTLRRCFGKKEKVLDCTWDQIKDLRTLAKPHVPMPRLKDLLEHLTQPGTEEVWLLLDIKLDNHSDTVMRLIGSTIAEVKATGKPWAERLVLGLWAAKYLSLAEKYLPGFPVMHIGYKLSYARHFFDVPNVGFNILCPMLIAPGGKSFMRDRREESRQLLAWTVNDADRMEWCIRRKIDGVITDDPSLFVAARERHDEFRKEPVVPVSFRSLLNIARIYIMVTTMFWLIRRRFRPDANMPLIQKVPSNKKT